MADPPPPVPDPPPPPPSPEAPEEEEEEATSSEDELRVEILGLRQLGTALLTRLGGKSMVSIRVQGVVGSEQRETGLSTWAGKGSPRSGEAVWSKKEGLLKWTMKEDRRPLRLYCYAAVGTPAERSEPSLENAELLGTLVVEMHELKQGKPASWAKLKGPGAPAEILFKGDVVRQKQQRPSPPNRTSLPAKRLGPGTTYFELCVSLERAGALNDLVAAKDLLSQEKWPYWFSYELLGVVLQTDQFRRLDAPGFKVECDWFRLQGSAHDVAKHLARPIEVFLCTDGVVVGAGSLSLGPLLPLDAWHPARSDDDFYASEARFRLHIDSRRSGSTSSSSSSSSEGWLEVSARLRRVGVTDVEAKERMNPRGWQQEPSPIVEDDYADDEDWVNVQEGSPGGGGGGSPSTTMLSTQMRAKLSTQMRAKWRLTVELLHVAAVLKDDEDYSLTYRAAALGQPREARTARFRLDSEERVTVRGRGSVAVFEFERLSAAELDELFTDRQGTFVVELRRGENVVATATLGLSGPFGDSRRSYDARPPRTLKRVIENDYPLTNNAGHLRARLTIDEFLDDDDDRKNWSAAVADRLVGESSSSPEEDDADDDEVAEEDGIAGGNVKARPSSEQAQKKKVHYCDKCHAPSDWATRVSAEAVEAEKKAWEAWRTEEEAAWAQRLRRKEALRLRKVDEQHEAARKAERDEAAAHRAEYGRLEAKLRASLKDVEARERALADADAALQRERGLRVSELQLLEKRLRDETRHAVDAEKRQTKALEKALAGKNAAVERAERRANAAEADFDRWRAAHRRTPEADLTNKLARSKAHAADLQSRLDRARAETAEAVAEKERARSHVHRLARALQRSRDELHDKARRDLDELKLEYKAREHRFVLDGDYKALQAIKNDLDSLRKSAAVHSDRSALAHETAQAVVGNILHNQQQRPTTDQAVVGNILHNQQQRPPPPPLGDKDKDKDRPNGRLPTATITARKTIPPAASPPKPPPPSDRKENYGVDDDDDDEEPPPPPPDDEEEDVEEAAARFLNETQRNDDVPPSAEDQLASLVAERRVLVEDAGYPLDDPVVRDLDALIEASHRAASE